VDFATNTIAYFTAMSMKRRKIVYSLVTRSWLSGFVTNTLAYFTAMSMTKRKQIFIILSPDCGSHFFIFFVTNTLAYFTSMSMKKEK